MGVIKRNYLTIMLGVLLFCVMIFFALYIVHLGESYLQEEVYVKNLVLDMMCDIAESKNPRQAMIDSVSEIDTLKNRGVYCAGYDSDLKLISIRSPLYDPNLNLLDNSDLKRDVRLQNRGKSTIEIPGNSEYRGHTMYVYFRWVYYNTDEAMLIVLGMSQFAVETDYEQGLRTGAWIIAAVFVLVLASAYAPIIRRKRGK